MNKVVTGLLIAVGIMAATGVGTVRGESDGFKAVITDPVKFASAWSPHFEANPGRYDSTIRYLSRGPDFWLALESGCAMFALAPSKKDSTATPMVVEMKFVDANPYPEISAEEPLPRKIRYYAGSDPRTFYETPVFSKIHYRRLFPGIDLYFVITRSTLEYYFVLSGYANLDDVVIEMKGVERLDLTEHGELSIRTASGTAIRPAPRFFQEVAGERREVQGSYVLLSGNRIGFNAPHATQMASLIVDPVLIYFDPSRNWSTERPPQPAFPGDAP